MKINFIKSSSNYFDSAPVNSKKGNAAKSDVTIKDKVEISGKGSRMCNTKDISRTIVSEIDKPISPERIAQLKNQIKNGTYKVSSSAIADAILKSKD